jgi:diguanylate cyclase (GGDEF)-like protein
VKALRKLDALRTLARLAGADTTDGVGAIAEAARIVGTTIGSGDVRLFAGDGVNFSAYPLRRNEDFFGLSTAGLMTASTELRRLGRAAVYTVGGEELPHDLAPADGRHAGTHVSLALWCGGSYTGSITARGPWTAATASHAGRLLEPAGPALAIILERVVDAARKERVEQQMNALSNVARVFTQSKNMRQVLQDVVDAINSATGFLSNIDVLDSRGRIVMRSTAASRFTGTPLYQSWLKMTKSPDKVRELILRDPQTVLLPDLQNDPRISEAARQFYKSAALVSASTLPLIFQGEVVGLLRVGSLKPTAFTPALVELLQNLAAQSAVVVKGVQLWEDLQRSRKETARYAAKLRAGAEIEHHLARVDHLCGIPNRRYLDEIITAECARAARYGSRLSLAMADLDNFKGVNDTYGHDAGDEVLHEVATIARSSCRKGDIVGRMGGDEFLFVMPSTSLGGAIASAERFRHALEGAHIPVARGDQVRITISLGLAEVDAESPGDPKTLLRRCDEFLYKAKASGKNTVRWYEPRLAEAV